MIISIYGLHVGGIGYENRFVLTRYTVHGTRFTVHVDVDRQRRWGMVTRKGRCWRAAQVSAYIKHYLTSYLNSTQSCLDAALI